VFYVSEPQIKDKFRAVVLKTSRYRGHPPQNSKLSGYLGTTGGNIYISNNK